MEKHDKDMELEELEEYKQFSKEACESAISACDCSRMILRKWKPKKEFGLSKKESRAAYLGFALGLFNGADAVMLGRQFTCDESLRRRMLKTVSEYKKAGDCSVDVDDDGDMPDDASVTEDPFIRSLIELLFGNGTEA